MFYIISFIHFIIRFLYETGIAAFEIDYGHWVEEQHRQNAELRYALQNNASDMQLKQLVESVLSNYSYLFRIKADATKADVFSILSGVWKSSVERMFLWIGGSRPSELLNVLTIHSNYCINPPILS